jgi:hypothetical protein
MNKRIEKKIRDKLRELYSEDKRNPKCLSWNIVNDAIKYSIFYTKKEIKRKVRKGKEKK